MDQDESRFSYFSNIDYGIAILNENNEIIYVNEHFSKLFGFTFEDLSSSQFSIDNLFHPFYGENPLTSNYISNTQFEMVNKDKKTISVIVWLSIIKGTNLRVASFYNSNSFHDARSSGFKEIINYAREKIGLAFYRFESVGPSLEESIDVDFIDDPELTLSQVGIYYMSSIQYKEGLFGPLPVSNQPDLLALVYSYSLDMSTLGIEEFDERMDGKQQAMIVIIYHNSLASFFNNHNRLQRTIDEIITKYHNTKQLLENQTNFLTKIKESIFSTIETKFEVESLEERLTTINSFVKQISFEDDIDSFYEQLVSFADIILDFKRFSVYHVDRMLNKLILVSHSGYSENLGFEEINLDKTSIVTRAVRTKSVQNIPNVKLDKDYFEEDESVISKLAVPVISPSEGIVVGLINVESDIENAFSRDDEIVLGSISHNISYILEREEIQTRFHSFFNLIKNLLKIKEKNLKSIFNTVYEFLSKTFSMEYFSGMIFDEEHNSLKIVCFKGYADLPFESDMISLDENNSIVVRTFKEKKIFNYGNVKHVDFYLEGDPKVHSEITAPIFVKEDEIIGVFNIESYQENAFTKTDERLVQIASQIIGLFGSYFNCFEV